jgi:hypothetical protein
LGQIIFQHFAFLSPYGTTRWNLFKTIFPKKEAPPLLSILPDGQKGKNKEVEGR